MADADPNDEDLDTAEEPEFDDEPILPTSAVSKFRRTGAGAVLGGVALGLRDIFDPVVREEAPMMQEAPGEPDNPRAVDAHLDPDDPTSSSVTVRPWRFEENE